MADQAIAAAPASPAAGAKTVKDPVLPEAFQPQQEAKSRPPEMDAFSELDEIDARNPAPDSRPPKKKPEATKPETPAASKPPTKKLEEPAKKPDTKAPEKPVEKPETKQEPAEPEGATADPDPSAKFQLANELRRDYRRIHSENTTLQKRIKDLESRKPNESSEERTALASQIETLKKRNDELEQEIRYHDYTKSSEFKEKFERPFQTKLADVYEQVKELTVQTQEGERAATPGDFDRIFEAPQEDVRRLAKELFGDDYFREVLQYRRELMEVRRNADREAKSYREKANERQQSQLSEQRKAREEAEQAVQAAHNRYIEKYPEWFGKVDGDDEINRALEEGFKAADRAYDKSLPMDQRVDLVAANRLKSAVFPRHILQIRRLTKRVAELEESLKAYEQSEPGEGQGHRSTEAASEQNGEKSYIDEIDEIERRNPVVR